MRTKLTTPNVDVFIYMFYSTEYLPVVPRYVNNVLLAMVGKSIQYDKYEHLITSSKLK